MIEKNKLIDKFISEYNNVMEKHNYSEYKISYENLSFKKRIKCMFFENHDDNNPSANLFEYGKKNDIYYKCFSCQKSFPLYIRYIEENLYKDVENIKNLHSNKVDNYILRKGCTKEYLNLNDFVVIKNYKQFSDYVNKYVNRTQIKLIYNSLIKINYNPKRSIYISLGRTYYNVISKINIRFQVFNQYEKPKNIHKNLIEHSNHSLPFFTNENLCHIKEKNSVILTEGIFDCLSLYSNGFKNVVFLGGLNLNQCFYDYLLNHKINNVIIATDNDEAGNSAYVKLSNSFIDYGIHPQRLIFSNEYKDLSEYYQYKSNIPFKVISYFSSINDSEEFINVLTNYSFHKIFNKNELNNLLKLLIDKYKFDYKAAYQILYKKIIGKNIKHFYLKNLQGK